MSKKLPDTLTAQQFDEWMFWLNKITDDCQTCLDHVRCLNDQPEDGRLWKEGMGQHLWQMYHFVWITQMAKLFCDKRSQKITFQKFAFRLLHPSNVDVINELLQAGATRDPAARWTSIDQVHQFATDMDPVIAAHQCTIDDLWNTRSSVIAHTDAVYGTMGPNNITHQAWKALTDTGTDIFRTVRAGFGGLPHPLAKSPSALVRMIAAFK